MYTKNMSTLSQKSATICRRKVRQSRNFALVSPFSATVALFCDGLTFLRQCGQGLSLA